MSKVALIQNLPNIDDLPIDCLRAIEQVRADSLDKLLCQEPLSFVIADAITFIEAYLDIHCLAVFSVSPQTGALELMGNPSVPTAFSSALLKTKIVSADDHCGQAYYTGRSEWVNNFISLPRHAELKRVAEHLHINACLSLPLDDHSGETLGALDLYTEAIEHLDADKFAVLRGFAIALGRIVERGLFQAKQAKTLEKLNSRLDEQHRDLTETHFMLKKALSQRDEVRSQLVEMEKMASMGTMVSSMTHEMNTPLGVALTAVTHLLKLQRDSRNAFDKQTLRRSQLSRFYDDCEDACVIAEKNLARAANVVEIFKQLSIDQHSEEQRHINLPSFICELLLSLKPKLKRTRHLFCLGMDSDLSFDGLPGALGQILINLVMNSVKHAYNEGEAGHICVFASVQESLAGKVLELTYSDDGRGMDDYTRQNIYRPFFTLAKHSGGSGLGMHICYNLAVNTLGGSIICESELAKGTRFTLRFPIDSFNSLRNRA